MHRVDVRVFLHGQSHGKNRSDKRFLEILDEFVIAISVEKSREDRSKDGKNDPRRHKRAEYS